MNLGFLGKGNASLPDALHEQINAGAIGLKLHEDWGTTPAAIAQFLQTPVTTFKDVMDLVHHYNKAVTHNSMKVMAVQIHECFQHVQTKVANLSSEVRWLAGDLRQAQVEVSRMKLLAHGFKAPHHQSPETRPSMRLYSKSPL